MDTILIVDDDAHIREVVSYALKQAGYAVQEAIDGLSGLKLFQKEQPTLIILDIMMPEMDGTEVCREIRKTSSVPIIFLTSKDEELDRIIGLELGGDDYVTKPFSPRELVARVRAVIRRLKRPVSHQQSPMIQQGQLRLDLDQFKAYWADNRVELTVTEFAVLRTLLQNPGKVYNRNELMQGAYDDHRYVSDRTIDSHVRRVRAKFQKHDGDPIETVHGLGYKLTDCQ